MADSKYGFLINRDVNSFTFNGVTYGFGQNGLVTDKFPTNNPCELKDFINALRAANVNNRGLQESTQDALDYANVEIEKNGCPGPPLDVTPQDPVANPPEENSSVGWGNDSGDSQSGPSPAVAGTLQVNKGYDAEIDSNPPPTMESTRPPEGQPHPLAGGEKPRQQTNVADPIDLFTGAYYLRETDLQIQNTLLPLSFIRSYRSSKPIYGPFGWNWDHNFNIFIRELNSGDIAVWRDLHEDLFQFDGTGFQPPRGVFEKLVTTAGLSQTFKLIGEGGIELHFERPAGWSDAERIPLVFIRDRHNNKLVFSFDTNNRISEVRDDDDHFFRFEYDLCGLLIRLSDQSGRSVMYEHDEEMMHLVRVTLPATFDQPEGISRYYHYSAPWSRPEIRHNIVSVEDSEGNVYLENSYQNDPSSWDYARVTEQLMGGYLFQFRYTQLQWIPAVSDFINVPAVRVEMMNPDLGLETYTFNYRGDLLDRRLRLNKDQSYRVVIWQFEFDREGNLSITTAPDGSQEKNTYDFLNGDPRMRGKLIAKEVTAATAFPGTTSRLMVVNSYEPVFQLLRTSKNEAAQITTYKYDFDLSPGALNNTGNLLEIILPATTLPGGTIQQAITRFEYNSKGQVTATILPEGTRNEMIYGILGDAKSRLIETIQDANGLRISVENGYDPIGNINRIVDGNGNSIQKVYNLLGLIEKLILPAVNGATAGFNYHYNSDKRLVMTGRPIGNYTDPVISGDAILDVINRDVLGYIRQSVLGSNTVQPRTISSDRDFRGYPRQINYPDGSKEFFTYDERGLLIENEIRGADGTVSNIRNTYDRTGKLIQVKDANGRLTKFEYDGFSRLAITTLPNGTRLINEWQANDLLRAAEMVGDPGTGVARILARKQFAYDENNRVVTETVKSFSGNPSTAIDLTTTFHYDLLNQVVKIVDARNGVQSLEYDGVGRLTVYTDTLGNQMHYQYDGNGNIIRRERHHQEPGGTISVFVDRYTFDERNRISETIAPDGAKWINEYDDRDRVIKQIDSLGIVKQIQYNVLGNTISELYDPAGLHLLQRWTLDEMERTTAYTDPTGEVSTFAWDGIGRQTRVEYPNGYSCENIFNGNGQVARTIMGSGVVFEYSYDGSGRLVKVDNPVAPAPIAPVATHSFSYDGLNRMLSAGSGIEQIVRQFDSLGRLVKESAFGMQITCHYDDLTGEVLKVWPDGRTERLSNDLNGALIKLEETVNGSLGAGHVSLATFIRSGPGYSGEARYHGGVTITNVYDERKRLTEIHAQSPAGTNEQIKYRYNAAGTLQVEALLGQHPALSYYEFDNKYRLLIARDQFATAVPNSFTQSEHDIAIALVHNASMAAAHQEQFAYDSADARIKRSETGLSDKSYTLANGHKIKNDGINNYSYYKEGTLQNDGLFSYDVDALGRIVKITTGAVTLTEIIYDAMGRPSMLKETGKPDRSFNYFGAFIVQESEAGTATRQVSVDPSTGIPIAYHSSFGTHYPFFDGRFNLVGLLDDNGHLLETFRYKAFGLPMIFDSSGTPIVASSIGIEPVFGGLRYLPDTGLFLSKRRLMDPRNGVFLSADPSGYIDSPHLYAYVAQDPVNFIDPDGLEKSSLKLASQLAQPASVDFTTQTEWAYTVTDNRLIPPITSIDTGSRPLNFVLNKIIVPWRNALAFYENIPLAVLIGIDDALEHSPIQVEYRNAQVMLPMMKTMGLAAELPGGIRYLNYWLSQNKSLTMAPVFASGVVGMGGGLGVVSSGSARSKFMRQSLRTILSNPEHPLGFLVDRKKRNWISRTHTSYKPSVQAGHLLSDWMRLLLGEPHRLAVEEALPNQFANWGGETGKRAWFTREAVKVEGVIVELESLKGWANEYPDLAKYLESPRVSGWTP